MPEAVPQRGLFEMRRLEQLSNTIFGVAMTLLAYDLPRTGKFTTMPDWADLYHLYAGRVGSLALSFIIAGVFWISHHRRLSIAPEASRGVVFLNLLFLLSIVLLPVTNGLYGTYRLSSAVAVVYGSHLTIIAALNALLWLMAPRDLTTRPELIGAVFPVFIFIPGTLVAIWAPEYAPYVWMLAFGGLLISRFWRAQVD